LTLAAQVVIFLSSRVGKSHSFGYSKGLLGGFNLFRTMKINVDSFWDKANAVAEQLGFELAEMSAPTVGGRLTLRVFIHSPRGVTLDDCARVSSSLSDMLDTEDLIQSRYTLEVSSLGLDRPLLTPRDFKRRIGERVKITYGDEKGQMSVEGLLKDSDEAEVRIDVDGETITIPVDANPRGKIVI
jgi:ribosome maturation factor RimP